MNEYLRIFIDEEQDEIFSENLFDFSKCGKWMLFYPTDEIDKTWQKAVHRYKGKELAGICAMKCSTAAYNPTASQNYTGIICFFCGPYDNEEVILDFGKNLVDKMDYTDDTGHVGYMTDEQQMDASGNVVNWLYKLPVPLTSPYS